MLYSTYKHEIIPIPQGFCGRIDYSDPVPKVLGTNKLSNNAIILSYSEVSKKVSLMHSHIDMTAENIRTRLHTMIETEQNWCGNDCKTIVVTAFDSNLWKNALDGFNFAFETIKDMNELHMWYVFDVNFSGLLIEDNTMALRNSIPYYPLLCFYGVYSYDKKEPIICMQDYNHEEFQVVYQNGWRISDKLQTVMQQFSNSDILISSLRESLNILQDTNDINSLFTFPDLAAWFEWEYYDTKWATTEFLMK